MLRKSSLLLVSIFVFCELALVQGPAQVGSTVIEGGTLIDGTGAPPLADAVVVIEGDRIRGVGRQGSVQYPPGARIIDARGKYVLPGIIDGHVGGEEWFLETLLAHGVTTIMGLHPSEWESAVADGIAKGKIRGPRIYSGVAAIRGRRSVCGGAVFLGRLLASSSDARCPAPANVDPRPTTARPGRYKGSDRDPRVPDRRRR